VMEQHRTPKGDVEHIGHSGATESGSCAMCMNKYTPYKDSRGWVYCKSHGK